MRSLCNPSLAGMCYLEHATPRRYAFWTSLRDEQKRVWTTAYRTGTPNRPDKVASSTHDSRWRLLYNSVVGYQVGCMRSDGMDNQLKEVPRGVAALKVCIKVLMMYAALVYTCRCKTTNIAKLVMIVASIPNPLIDSNPSLTWQYLCCALMHI